ncbi:tetratricopeptide repeat protein [Streptomyces sp. NPDC005573]|uniref:tetratricopeptide repeat protein n=1 Tax=Streptomyces sp. NPDC005573 TaxID=3156890 RepID=UPI0033A325A8
MRISAQRSVVFRDVQNRELAEEAARLCRTLHQPMTVRQLGAGDLQRGWQQVEQLNLQLRIHLDGLLMSVPPEERQRARRLAASVEAICVADDAHQSRVFKNPGRTEGFVIAVSAIALGLAAEVALQMPGAYAFNAFHQEMPRTRAGDALEETVLGYLRATAPGREEPVAVRSAFGAAERLPGLSPEIREWAEGQERDAWVSSISFALQHELCHIWENHFDGSTRIDDALVRDLPPAMRREVQADCSAATSLVNYHVFVRLNRIDEPRVAEEPEAPSEAADPEQAAETGETDPDSRFTTAVRYGTRLMIEAIESFYTASLLMTEYSVHMGAEEDELKRSDLILRRQYTRFYLDWLCETEFPARYGFEIGRRRGYHELHNRFISEVQFSIWDLDAAGGEQTRQEEIERWEAEFARGDAEAAFKLGGLHVRRGRPEGLTWFQRAAEAGHRAAAAKYGLLLDETGRKDEAEHWYRRAAEAGYASAIHNLGVLLWEAERPAEAEPWLRSAAEAGNARSAACLSMLLRASGATEEADRWLRIAAENGAGGAGSHYALTLRMNGQEDEAERWWREAAMAGRPEAVYCLGLALDEKDSAEAEGWLRKGAMAGHAGCMVALGSWLTRHGDTAEAREWLTEAAATGHTGAAGGLADLCHQAGDAAGARRWWRKAAGHGSAEAAHNLAVISHAEGRTEESLRWMRQAAEGGVASSAYNLGIVRNLEGDRTEAEAWFRRAAEQGHDEAAYNLALFLARRGQDEEAERWYRQAALGGDAEAANNLGALVVRQGRTTEAEYWFRQAVENGHTDAVSNLGRLLSELGRVEEAVAVMSRAADGGSGPAAFNLGWLAYEQGRLEEARTWWQKAADAGHPGAEQNLASLRDAEE